MKTFMVQASLTIVTYDHKNMFIVQAPELHSKTDSFGLSKNMRCYTILPTDHLSKAILPTTNLSIGKYFFLFFLKSFKFTLPLLSKGCSMIPLTIDSLIGS
jgi:hypothetical protein